MALFVTPASQANLTLALVNTPMPGARRSPVLVGFPRVTFFRGGWGLGCSLPSLEAAEAEGLAWGGESRRGRWGEMPGALGLRPWL